MAHDDSGLPHRDALALLRSLSSDAPAPESAKRQVAQRLTAMLTLSDGALPHGGADHSSVTRLVSAPHSLGATAAWVLLGGVAATTVYVALVPPNERIVYVDRPVPALAASVAQSSLTATSPIPEANVAKPSISPTSDISLVPTSSGDSSSSERSSPSSRGRSNDATEGRDGRADVPSGREERILLDLARQRLANGEVKDALQALTQHVRRFSSGKLAEERDALLVNALVRAGEFTQAREKADAFRKRYPTSFLSPSVEAAAANIPR